MVFREEPAVLVLLCFLQASFSIPLNNTDPLPGKLNYWLANGNHSYLDNKMYSGPIRILIEANLPINLSILTNFNMKKYMQLQFNPLTPSSSSISW